MRVGRMRHLLLTCLSGTTLGYLYTVFWLGLAVLGPMVALGWSPVAVVSGSMTPAVSFGDVVLIEPYDGRPLAAGTIVTFEDPAAPGRITTHRITGVNDDGTYETKGDANRVADSTPLRPGSIQGAARLVVPHVGLPIAWLETGQAPVAVALVLVSLAGYACTCVVDRRGPRERRQPRRSQPAGRQPAGWARQGIRALADNPVPIVVGLTAAVLGTNLLALTGVVGEAAFAATSPLGGNTYTSATVTTPGGVSATYVKDGGTDTAVVDWSATGDPGVSYAVRRSMTSGGPYTTVAQVGSTTWTDTAVAKNTTYYYVVRAHVSSWNSPNSTEVAVTVSPSNGSGGGNGNGNGGGGGPP